MTKHKSGYIICGEDGPMFWEEPQLVYCGVRGWQPGLRVQVFDTRHFALGMGIRNALRKAGIKDTELPQGNWDDYYVSTVEMWIGVRK